MGLDEAAGSNSLDASHNITTISLTPEQFERMYLSAPRNTSPSTVDIRSTFGNPTPLAVLGLVMSLTPLSCDLMGWRGSGTLGVASTGAYFFMGGFLMILSGILEFFLGHTFQFIIFLGYGSFWLTFGATLQPVFGAYSTYSPDPTKPAEGLSTMGFNASFAFYILFMAIFSLLACIASLKINLCYVLLEFFVTLFFTMLAATFFELAEGGSNATDCQTASGAFGFVASILGWYYFFATTVNSIGTFPFTLPIIDLSGTSKSSEGGLFHKKAAVNAHDKEAV